MAIKFYDDLRVYHSDGSYASLRGQGLFLNRSNVYVAPLADNFSSLNIGYDGGRWGNVEINAATVKFENGANERMRINSSGNVGIGTTSPAQKLEVHGGNINIQNADGAYLTFNNGDASIVANYNGSGRDLSFKTYNGTATAEKARIDKDGKVKFNSYGSGTNTGTLAYKLGVDSSGNVIETAVGAGAVDGSGTANYVTKWTDADTIGNSIIFDNGTNVGIGTTSPSAPLDIRRSDTSGKVAEFHNSVGYGIDINVESDGGVNTISSATNQSLAFVTNGGSNERMRIGITGNVGIGTNSPETKLDVRGQLLVAGDTPVARIGSTLEVYRNGTTAELSIHQDDSTVSSGLFSQLRFRNGGNDTYFKVPQNGNGLIIDVESKTNAFVIGTTGNVGIGTTSPSEELDVNGTVSAIANYSAGNSKIIYKAQRSGGAVAGDWSYDDATTDMSLGTSTAHSFSLKTGNTRALTINNSQNATFAGDVLVEDNLYLTDAGTVRGKIQLNSSDKDDLDIIAVSLGSNVKFFTVGTERMRITSGGKVGIGTTSPAEKLEVAGNIKLGDSNKLLLGTSSDLIIEHTGSFSRIQENGPGSLYLQGENLIFTDSSGTDTYAIFTHNAGVSFRYDNAVKLETTSTGVTVTGTVDLTNLTVSSAQGTDGQVLTSTGSGIAWEDAGGGSGTVTSVAAGTGLTGGTITTSGTIALDYAENDNFILASGTQLNSADDDDILAIVDVDASRQVKYIEKSDFLEDQVTSVITGEPTGSDSLINIVSLTQAEYDAGTPVATTLYIIT